MKISSYKIIFSGRDTLGNFGRIFLSVTSDTSGNNHYFSQFCRKMKYVEFNQHELLHKCVVGMGN